MSTSLFKSLDRDRKVLSQLLLPANGCGVLDSADT